MFPSPNRQMQQPNRRPPQPMGQAPANQPNSLNQNGQEPQSQVSGATPVGPEGGMRYGSAPSGAMGALQSAFPQGQPSYPHQNPIQPPEPPAQPMGGMMGQPAPSMQPPPTDPQPMPAAAQQATSGPMAPPQPYQRQNMPQQSQANRRLSPRQA